MEDIIIGILCICLIVSLIHSTVANDINTKTSTNGRCPRCHSYNYRNTHIFVTTNHSVYPRAYLCKCKLCQEHFNLPIKFYKE